MSRNHVIRLNIRLQHDNVILCEDTFATITSPVTQSDDALINLHSAHPCDAEKSSFFVKKNQLLIITNKNHLLILFISFCEVKKLYRKIVAPIFFKLLLKILIGYKDSRLDLSKCSKTIT